MGKCLNITLIFLKRSVYIISKWSKRVQEKLEGQAEIMKKSIVFHPLVIFITLEYTQTLMKKKENINSFKCSSPEGSYYPRVHWGEVPLLPTYPSPAGQWGPPSREDEDGSVSQTWWIQLITFLPPKYLCFEQSKLKTKINHGATNYLWPRVSSWSACPSRIIRTLHGCLLYNGINK